MRIRIELLLIALLIVIVSACSGNKKPPVAPVKAVTEDYYGVSVTDPYRYMENMDDTIFLNWMKEYARYTRDILDQIPGKKEILDKMLEFSSRKSDMVYTLAISETNRYFYMKMTPGALGSAFRTMSGPEGKESLLFDP